MKKLFSFLFFLLVVNLLSQEVQPSPSGTTIERHESLITKYDDYGKPIKQYILIGKNGKKLNKNKYSILWNVPIFREDVAWNYGRIDSGAISDYFEAITEKGQRVIIDAKTGKEIFTSEYTYNGNSFNPNKYYGTDYFRPYYKVSKDGKLFLFFTTRGADLIDISGNVLAEKVAVQNNKIYINCRNFGMQPENCEKAIPFSLYTTESNKLSPYQKYQEVGNPVKYELSNGTKRDLTKVKLNDKFNILDFNTDEELLTSWVQDLKLCDKSIIIIEPKNFGIINVSDWKFIPFGDFSGGVRPSCDSDKIRIVYSNTYYDETFSDVIYVDHNGLTENGKTVSQAIEQSNAKISERYAKRKENKQIGDEILMDYIKEEKEKEKIEMNKKTNCAWCGKEFIRKNGVDGKRQVKLSGIAGMNMEYNHYCSAKCRHEADDD